MTETHREDEAAASDHAPAPPVPTPASGRTDATGPTDAAGPTDATGRPGEPVYETGVTGLLAVLGAIVLVGLWFGWAVPIIVLGFALMIFLHELGHYVTARWSGMKATEFFIGFGPRIWSFRRGETEYGLKAIPAGAYVRIIGMNNLDEVDPADEPRTYRQQSFPKRLLVVSAGSIMHMLQAFVLLVVLLGVVGVPGGSLTDDAARARNWEVNSVVQGSAADDAGLREGDRIVSFNGRDVATWADVTDDIRASEVGDEVTLGIERDGRPMTLSAELRPRPARQGGDEGSPFLGVGAAASREAIGLGSAIVKAPGEMASFIGEAGAAMGSFFSPRGISDFADTVGRADDPAPASSGSGGAQVSSDDGSDNRVISIYGAIRMAVQLSADGWMWVLLMFFQVNIFIGILNMAPLPPLDGGHAAVAVYERIRSRAGRRYHADMAKLLPLTYAVIMGLLVLGVASLYLDIVNPIDV